MIDRGPAPSHISAINLLIKLINLMIDRGPAPLSVLMIDRGPAPSHISLINLLIKLINLIMDRGSAPLLVLLIILLINSIELISKTTDLRPVLLVDFITG